MAKYQTGDWVLSKKKHHKYSDGTPIMGVIAKVEDLGAFGGHYVVNWLSRDKSVSVGNDFVAEEWLIDPPLEIDETALNELFMDLALATKDYSWAKSISTSKVKNWLSTSY